MASPSGYRGKALELLRAAGAEVGDRVKVELPDRVYEGLLMPRIELGDPEHLVIKLDNGYNVGIRIREGIKLTKLAPGRPPKLVLPPLEVKPDPSKPLVSILGTGGTVACRVDYRTGAVYPAFTAEELYAAVPELTDLANIRTLEVANVFSENMTPELWIKIGKAIARELNSGARGAVIAHGTDTMGYTAAALSFTLRDLPKPVALVGAQRSSDRPSSDAALNLISAVAVAARSDLAEVCVVMHGSMEDDFCLIHRGTKVRKCHTSRRDTFQTINDLPLGLVRGGEVRMLRQDYRRVKPEGKVKLDAKFEPKVALVKIYPGMGPDVIEGLVSSGYKGLVLEGTGLGHTPEFLFGAIKQAVERGIPVAMTSQCIWGRVDMKVYSTGRDLLNMGVIPCEDMLPETAYVKLMWVLGHTKDLDEVAKLMRKNFAGEITPRTRPEVFPKPFLPEPK